MGAQAHLARADVGWLSPLALWSGILAGPIAWAIDLEASYALVKWVCGTGHRAVLHALTAGSLVVIAGGALVSWMALQQTREAGPTDAGRPRPRARFMAVLGLGACALFALQILANDLPTWVIDACR